MILFISWIWICLAFRKLILHCTLRWNPFDINTLQLWGKVKGEGSHFWQMSNMGDLRAGALNLSKMQMLMQNCKKSIFSFKCAEVLRGRVEVQTHTWPLFSFLKHLENLFCTVSESQQNMFVDVVYFILNHNFFVEKYVNVWQSENWWEIVFCLHSKICLLLLFILF